MEETFEFPVAYNAEIELPDKTITGAGTSAEIIQGKILDHETEEAYSLKEIEEQVQNAMESNQELKIDTGDADGEYLAGRLTLPIEVGYAVEFFDFGDDGGPLHYFASDDSVRDTEWLENKLQTRGGRVMGYYPHQKGPS